MRLATAAAAAIAISNPDLATVKALNANVMMINPSTTIYVAGANITLSTNIAEAASKARRKRAAAITLGTLGSLIAAYILLTMWYHKTKLPFESACGWTDRVVGLRCYIMLSPCIPCIRWSRQQCNDVHCCESGGVCACMECGGDGDDRANYNDANNNSGLMELEQRLQLRPQRGTYTTEDFVEMFERMKQTGEIHADAPTSSHVDRYPREILRDDIRLLSRLGGGQFGKDINERPATDRSRCISSLHA